jgi:spore coat protein U-like protein
MSNSKSNTIMWSDTPLKDKPKNVGWSQDATIRVYRNEGNEKDSTGNRYDNFIAYKLYYDSKENSVYLKDIRSNVLYSIPSGAKAKGYTLAFKLNIAYNEAL